MNNKIKTLRDAKAFDELVNSYLYPSSLDFDVIGTLIRKGKRIAYAFVEGIYYEAPTRLLVAQKLATKYLNR